MDAEDAVIVSEALFTVTETGINEFAGAYIPLAGMAAEISQLPVPTTETSPLIELTVQTAEFDDVYVTSPPPTDAIAETTNGKLP
jgi:hypothetical protein